MRGVAALGLMALAACQPAEPSGPVRTPGLSLVPAPGGLLVQGSGGREIGFGRDQAGVLESVARIEGTAPRPVPCSDRRVAFSTAGTVRLVFERGSFVGWQTIQDEAGRSCP